MEEYRAQVKGPFGIASQYMEDIRSAFGENAQVYDYSGNKIVYFKEHNNVAARKKAAEILEKFCHIDELEVVIPIFSKQQRRCCLG